jgi:cytochrome c biogenesis factor
LLINWIVLISSLVIGVIGSVLFPLENASMRTIISLLCGLLLAFIVPTVWTRLLKVFRSKEFVLMMMIGLIVLTILGTLIIQKEAPVEYFQIYGDILSRIIFYLSFQDIFNSAIFVTCLTLIGASIFSYLFYKVRNFKVRDLGLILVHIAVILIFVGGVIGKLWGDKGVLSLRAGDTSEKYHSQVKFDSCNFDCGAEYLEFSKNREKVHIKKMPYALRLNKFTVSYYPNEYIVYLLNFDHESKSYDVVESWNVDEPRDEKKLDGTNFAIKNIKQDDKGNFELTIHDVSKDTYDVIKFDLNDPRIVTFENSKRAITIRKPELLPKEFLSNVSLVTLSDNSRIDYEIRVNEPLILNNYYIYQSSFKKDDVSFSIFEIVYDPGVPYVFAGFFVMIAGIVFFMISRIKRNKGVK